MAKNVNTKPQVASKGGAPAGKPRRWRFLLIILVPFVITVGGVTAIHFWSKPKPELPPALPNLKLEGIDPAIVRAIDDCRAEIQKSPRSGPGWGRLGITLAVHDFIIESDYCFGLAEKFDPHEARWPYWRGLALSGENLGAALPCFERAARLCTNVPAVPLRYAEALIERGQLDLAEKQIRAVYNQNTNDARALLGLGRIALAQDQLPQSLQYLTRSATLATNVRASYALLSAVQQRLGNSEAAEKARQLSTTSPEIPEWPDRYLTEANTFRAGKASAANLADLLLQKGRPAEALAIMQRITREYPDFVKGWILLGKASMDSQDFAGAEKALRTAAKLQPESVDNQNELGRALFAQGRYPEAETCYREALRIKSNQAESWFNLGLCLMNQKNNEGAVEAFRSAVRYKPDLTYAYIRWGQALGRLRRAPEAIEQLQHALQLSPDNAEAKEMLDILQKPGALGK